MWLAGHKMTSGEVRGMGCEEGRDDSGSGFSTQAPMSGGVGRTTAAGQTHSTRVL